jgi:predicted transcriptional regulator
MKQITLGLPPEIMDALQHLGGRDDAEMHRIICDALRSDFQRRAQKARLLPSRPPPKDDGDGHLRLV